MNSFNNIGDEIKFIDAFAHSAYVNGDIGVIIDKFDEEFSDYVKIRMYRTKETVVANIKEFEILKGQ